MNLDVQSSLTGSGALIRAAWGTAGLARFQTRLDSTRTISGGARSLRGPTAFNPIPTSRAAAIAPAKPARIADGPGGTRLALRGVFDAQEDADRCHPPGGDPGCGGLWQPD